jgi:hypothetical protein
MAWIVITQHHGDKPMSNEPASQLDISQHVIYQIRVKGHLDSQWAGWFDGMTITLEEDGNTLLSGPVVDQAALHGLLKKVRDLGLPLISLAQVQPNYSIKGEKMNTNITPAKKIDTQALLSTLWIVVMLNMLKADILSLYIPGTAEELARTSSSVGTPIPQLMLGGAIMMEISIAMIILSRVLKYGVNRWLNIIVSLITIVFVIGGGVSYPHYIFIATVEVVCLLLIIGFAWVWRSVEA